ncbi:MAG: sigma-54-dependent Fis family transcriptional regulator [Proteobacteria bacterium]|nr:sigma-54-dependent Fis family transcriptional regulator [Pseudomonadota bacterium]
MNTYLVGARDRDVAELIRKATSSPRQFVDFAPDYESLHVHFVNRRYDFTFVDLALLEPLLNEGEDPASILQRFLGVYPSAQIVILVQPDQIQQGVGFVTAGASNYITYPINPDELRFVLESIDRSLLMEMELSLLRDSFWEGDAREVVMTRNPRMKEVYDKIKSVASTNATVLLQGETGTGKNIVARLIHSHGPRKKGPFISVHCGAIPSNLIESELFGHEKGAFTGAVRRKLGRFEIARGGTIFLDEIGTTPLQVQVELLQIIQEKTFTRVGGELPLEADVRIIAASNENLRSLCDQGLFRTDLYYRLNVFPIDLPPLSERREDIPLFVEHFLKKLNRTYGKEIIEVDPEVIEVFEGYPWPGNLREMENIIERAYILASDKRLTIQGLPSDLIAGAFSMSPERVEAFLPLGEARARCVDNFEALYLRELLRRNDGRIGRSAEAAGVTPRQLQKLMKKHSIRKENFKNIRR